MTQNEHKIVQKAELDAARARARARAAFAHLTDDELMDEVAQVIDEVRRALEQACDRLSSSPWRRRTHWRLTRSSAWLFAVARDDLGEGRTLLQLLTRVDGVGELIVVRTVPGGAQPVASALDGREGCAYQPGRRFQL